MRAPPRKRLGREDWEQAALDAIARDGLAAIAVEPLAARLGVTKGSFYAHFPSREALVDAALSRWEHSHGLDSLSELGGVLDPQQRLEQVMLAAITFTQSGAPSVHVRLLNELHDLRVREAVARVTAMRVKRLASIYRELGFAPRPAESRARLAYATYLGLLGMAQETPNRRLTKNDIDRLMAELRDTLLAPAMVSR